MKKRIVLAGLAGAVMALAFVFGFMLGEAKAEDPNYLGVIYGLGQRSAVEGFESLLNAPKSNDLFGHLHEDGYSSERTYVYSMDGIDNKGTGDSYWILWAKCVNGEILMGRAKTYHDVP